jgi:hypothetical protein
VLLETEPDTERRENVSAARFRDTESHTAGVGLRSQLGSARPSLSWLVKVTSHRVSSARLVYKLESARLDRELKQKKMYIIIIF